MSNSDIINHLEQLQEQLKSKRVPSDFVVHIDDAVEFLRSARHAGFKIERGLTVFGTKGSYWHVLQYNIPVFKIMINVHRNTPRGEVIVVPHSAYKPPFEPQNKFDNPFNDWKHRYGIGNYKPPSI